MFLFFGGKSAKFSILLGFMVRKKQEITVGFVSLGCPKNVVDSERMLAEIVQAGFPITNETDNADVVVVNTCGFIAPAEAESLEAIKHAVDCKLNGAVKKVVVAGCLSERLGAELPKKIDGIDAVVGLSQRDNIAKIIEKLFSSGPFGRVEGSCPDESLPPINSATLGVPANQRRLRSPLLFLHDTGNKRQVPKQTYGACYRRSRRVSFRRRGRVEHNRAGHNKLRARFENKKWIVCSSEAIRQSRRPGMASADVPVSDWD